MHIINHKYAHLWIESGILQQLTNASGNPKTLKDILQEVQKYSINRTVKLTGCKKKDAKKEDEYKNTFGWMGEVLCEFWLHTFGHRMDLRETKDTSENQFQRGFDFTASVITDDSLSSIIQVKMQSEDRQFTKYSLHTFFDEAKKHGINPKYTLLMVPTAELPKQEMLDWKEYFKEKYSCKFIFIGQKLMNEHILSLTTTVQGENPNLEFFIRFRESLNASCTSAIPAI